MEKVSAGTKRFEKQFLRGIEPTIIKRRLPEKARSSLKSFLMGPPLIDNMRVKYYPASVTLKDGLEVPEVVLMRRSYAEKSFGYLDPDKEVWFVTSQVEINPPSLDVSKIDQVRPLPGRFPVKHVQKIYQANGWTSRMGLGFVLHFRDGRKAPILGVPISNRGDGFSGPSVGF